MEFLVLSGYPGVGKYSVALEVTKLANYANFHNHLTVDPVLSLFEFGSANFVEMREKIWFGLLDRAFKEKSKKGIVFTLAWDSSLDPLTLCRLQELADTNDVKFLSFELTCDEDELKTRLQSSGRKKNNKISDYRLFRELEDKGALGHLKKPDHHKTIDTTSLSALEAAEIVKRSLSVPRAKFFE